jgi:site-specific recombinase XerD
MPVESSQIIDFRTAVRRLAPEHPVYAPKLTTLLPLWIADRNVDNWRPRGTAAYEDKFEQFIAFAGNISASEITEALVKNYKRDCMDRVSAGTTRNALTVVRSFCDWCMAEGYLRENVAKRVPHPHVEEPDADPLDNWRSRLRPISGHNRARFGAAC